MLNSDLLGSILGDESALGHQVVFLPIENQFYFRDPLLEAICPTNTAKLQLLASNYLVKCAEACSGQVEVAPLLDELRRSPVLQQITHKSRAILEADRTFFEGHLINPTFEPSHREFIQKATMKQQDARIAMPELHRRYVRFCHQEHLQALTSPEFRRSVPEIVEEIHGLGLRHDIQIQETGKQAHGWIGLGCLQN